MKFILEQKQVNIVLEMQNEKPQWYITTKEVLSWDKTTQMKQNLALNPEVFMELVKYILFLKMLLLFHHLYDNISISNISQTFCTKTNSFFVCIDFIYIYMFIYKIILIPLWNSSQIKHTPGQAPCWGGVGLRKQSLDSVSLLCFYCFLFCFHFVLIPLQMVEQWLFLEYSSLIKKMPATRFEFMPSLPGVL